MVRWNVFDAEEVPYWSMVRALLFSLLLVACRDGASHAVDARGGVLDFGDVRLVVPPDAVATRVEIDVAATGATLPADWRGLSPVYEFQPHGLRFAVPVELSVRTAEAGTIQWMDRLDDEALEVLTTSRDGDWLVADITHFSFGFAGVPASVDAGIDSSVDAGVFDGGVDASDSGDSSGDAGPTDLDCWVERVMDPDPTVDTASVPLVPSELVEAPDGTLYQIRLSTLYEWNGVEWSRTELSLAAGLGIAAESFRGASLAIDDAGNLHAVLHAAGRVAQPNPFYLRRDGASWIVEDVYPTAPSELGLGVCYSDYTQKSNIAIESDGTVHALFDCAWHADGQRYRPIMYCTRTDDWACSIVDAPLPGESDPGRPDLALESGALHVYFERNIDAARVPFPTDGFALNHYRTLDGTLVAGPIIDEYCPGTGCLPPATPAELDAISGSMLIVGGRPVVYYPYLAEIDPRVPGPLRTLVRRAELVAGSFVVRDILDQYFIESNAVVLADGREVVMVRGQHLIAEVPGFERNDEVGVAIVESESVQTVLWTGLNDSTGRGLPNVTLAAHTDGSLHATYLGSDGALHHAHTCD